MRGSEIVWCGWERGDLFFKILEDPFMFLRSGIFPLGVKHHWGSFFVVLTLKLWILGNLRLSLSDPWREVVYTNFLGLTGEPSRQVKHFDCSILFFLVTWPLKKYLELRISTSLILLLLCDFEGYELIWDICSAELLFLTVLLLYSLLIERTFDEFFWGWILLIELVWQPIYSSCNFRFL